MATDLRTAAQQALEAMEAMQSYAAAERKGLLICDESIIALRAALEQPEQATGKESLQVDPKGGMQIATPLPLTTTDLAWLETRRLVRVWQELGQIRWAGADQGWDRAIEGCVRDWTRSAKTSWLGKRRWKPVDKPLRNCCKKLRGMKDE